MLTLLLYSSCAAVSLTVSLYLAKNLVVHYRNADLFTSLFHPMFKVREGWQPCCKQ